MHTRYCEMMFLTHIRGQYNTSLLPLMLLSDTLSLLPYPLNFYPPPPLSESSGVLDGYIMEQTAVCPENVVHPELYQPPLSDHTPCPVVLWPCCVEQEEVDAHVLHSHVKYILHSFFVSSVTFWIQYVEFQLSHHHECQLAWEMFHGPDEALNEGSVIRGQIEPHD